MAVRNSSTEATPPGTTEYGKTGRGAAAGRDASTRSGDVGGVVAEGALARSRPAGKAVMAWRRPKIKVVERAPNSTNATAANSRLRATFVRLRLRLRLRRPVDGLVTIRQS